MEVEVNFTIQIIEEALDFIDTLKDMLTLFYSSCMQKSDLEILDEDLYKLVVGSVVKGQVYKIITIISRIDNELYDKDMRYKFKELKYVLPKDIGIDTHYLLNNDPSNN